MQTTVFPTQVSVKKFLLRKSPEQETEEGRHLNRHHWCILKQSPVANMGNQPSSQQARSSFGNTSDSSNGTPVPVAAKDDKERFRSFPGSALLEKTFCGSIDTTDPSEYQNQSIATRLMHKADVMCIRSPRNYDASSPVHHWEDDDNDILLEQHRGKKPSISSALLARALVSEVTDNPKTMNPVEMATRERKLLKAQQAARNGPAVHKPIGTRGAGVGPPSVLNSVAYALTGQDNMLCVGNSQVADDVVVSGALHDAFGEHGGRSGAGEGSHLALEEALHEKSPYVVTIALCLSRRYEDVGHPKSITRQTAFDFNEVQDREYKYVSSTDAMGWRAGGGEMGGPLKMTGTSNLSPAQPEPGVIKKDHRDDLHLPIIHLDCGSAEGVDQVIHTLASGDIFIPHMAVLPDSLAVHGSPLPDLMLRWQCDRNEDVPVDEWHNWCLEFIHNQIFEYFHQTSVRPIWMPRPFNVTLAKAVRWRTVKHMNRYFSLTEQVLERWRENGPQYLDPHSSHTGGGASPDELARPHGIYLWRKVNGVTQPTNYFAPNFDTPYTTKMTRCLLETVLSKSWDTQRREWSNRPLPVILSPAGLLQAACGCTEVGGFVAQEVTNKAPPTVPFSLSSKSQPPIARHSPHRPDQTNGTHQADAIADEKKNDETALPEETMPISRKSPARQSLSSTINGPDVSGTFSVAASGTTVMHRNLSHQQLQSNEKRLFSDDDWGATPTIVSDPPGEKVCISCFNFNRILFFLCFNVVPKFAGHVEPTGLFELSE